MTDTSADADTKREAEWNEKLIETKIGRLTANLIRITRGSGKTYDVESQIMELAELLAKHRAITSQGVSPHLFNQSLLFNPKVSDEDGELAALQRARSEIVWGALQLAASEILENNTTKAQGEAQLLEGQKQWEDLCKRRSART